MAFKDASLLRGTSPGEALAGRAAIFDSSQPCTAEYYSRSHVVDGLNTFVSHNWSTSRWKKYLVIAVHFNSTPALINAALCVILVACLQATGVAPCLKVHFLHMEREVGLGCSISASVVYALSLLFWHEVARRLRHKAPAIFVDKVCVHQTDLTLKQEGIEHLAAFICNSNDILICYSKTYLKRLWTVYEVAMFMLIHPGRVMHIRPEFFPIMILTGNLIMFSRHLLWLLVHTTAVDMCMAESWQRVVLECGFESDIVLDMLCFWPTGLLLCIFLRTWIMEQKKVLDHVKNFRISDAACFEERDRKVVQRNIELFMKHLNYVPPTASDQETYEVFEALVHAEVPVAFRSSLGRVGIPFKLLVGMTVPKFAIAFDWISVMAKTRVPTKLMIQSLLFRAGVWLGVFPIIVFFANELLWFTLRIKKRIVLPIMALASFAAAFAIAVFLYQTSELDMDQRGVRLGLLLGAGVSLTCSFALYRPGKMHRPRVPDVQWEAIETI